MAISRQLAGFSPSRADDLRKAVGKKDKVLMASLKDEFIEGCIESGTDRKVAQSLWGLCEAAGDYSFNKSHAACYALLAYRTAYLKANHPAEYMASLLCSVMDTKDRVPFYVAACSEMGLSVLPPDVNVSRLRLRGDRGAGDPLRPHGGEGRGGERGRGDHRRARRGRALRVASGTSAGASTRRRSTSAPWRASSAAAPSTRPAPRAPGHARAISAAVGQASRRRSDLAAGQESLFGGARAATGGVGGARPADPVPEMPQGRAAARREGGARPLRLEPPAAGLPPASWRAPSPAASPRLADRADGEPVTVGGHHRRGEEHHHPPRRADDVRAPRRPRGVGRGGRRPGRARRGARAAAPPTRMVLIPGRVDQKGEGETKLVAQAMSPSRPRRAARRSASWCASTWRAWRRPRSPSSGGCWWTTAARRRS